MKSFSRLPLFLVLCFTLTSAGAAPVPAGMGQVTLVNGFQFNAEILFKHPNVERVVMRSANRTTLQSLPVSIIHSITVGSRSATLSPRRGMTEEEIETIKKDTLWGDQAGPGQIGNYANEVWEDAPVAVWAHPGQDGSAMDPENWLDRNGRPYPSLHWTDGAGNGKVFHGDILMPAADTRYMAIQAGSRDHLPEYSMRHLTVEDMATYQVHYRITGNLWMKSGSHIAENTQRGFFGNGDDQKHHVFMRFANGDAYWEEALKVLTDPSKVDTRFAEEAAEESPRWAYTEALSHWFNMDWGEYSGEVIGFCGGPGDRITLNRGTLVLSKNASLKCGDRAGFSIKEGSTLILLDGSRFAYPGINKGGSGGKTIGNYGINGTIMFGTPEHPLTEDYIFGASPYPTDEVNRNITWGDRASGASYVFGPDSRIEIHSVDPATARVVFRMRNKHTMPFGMYFTREGKDLNRFHNDHRPFLADGRRVRYNLPIDYGFWDAPDFPKGQWDGLSAVFLGEADLNGVVFDDFVKGGIIVPEETRKRWKNVTLGDNNRAPGIELLSEPNR